MLAGGLEVLADGEEIAANGPEGGHRFEEFCFRFAEPDHHPGLRRHVRVDLLYALQQFERKIIVTARANFSEYAPGSLDVVVQDVRPGRNDPFE